MSSTGAVRLAPPPPPPPPPFPMGELRAWPTSRESERVFRAPMDAHDRYRHAREHEGERTLKRRRPDDAVEALAPREKDRSICLSIVHVVGVAWIFPQMRRARGTNFARASLRLRLSGSRPVRLAMHLRG